jgi:hypothetical protein
MDQEMNAPESRRLLARACQSALLELEAIESAALWPENYAATKALLSQKVFRAFAKGERDRQRLTSAALDGLCAAPLPVAQSTSCAGVAAPRA